MFKRILLTITLLMGLGTAPVFAAEAQGTTPAPGTITGNIDGTNPFAWMTNPGTATSGNMFDPMAWMSMMSGQPGAQNMNLARPEGWAVFMNPATYPALMNPATYGQFMSPKFYMQFANPNNWMSWMNPAAYGAYMNPATYAQMMNPMAYMQFMNPGTYMQWMNPGNYTAFMNPNTYFQWMNPAAYSFAGTDQGSNPQFNWFDPNVWSQMFTPPQQN